MFLSLVDRSHQLRGALGLVPLRERPGIGTIANLVVIAYVLDLTTYVMSAPSSPAVKATYVVVGVGVIGVGSALYLTTGWARGRETA